MIKNLLLTLFSTLLTLLLVEGVLRSFYADYLYTGSGARSLYYSSPNLMMTDDNKSVHYVPNTDIRSIAVYYNKVEYDTKHHANNFGFLSDENYVKENKSGVAFVGDSFTAGVGSTKPWIPELNTKYKNINLYNLGVTGTGIWNFYHTLITNQNALNFDTIVIMSISDDLRRHQWYPVEKNNYLYFCYEGDMIHACKKDQRIAKFIQYDTDESTLLQPEEMYIYKAFQLLKHKYETLEKQNKPKPIKSVLLTNLNYDMVYITKIKEFADQTGKKVIFVHIPEKREVTAKYYRCKIKDDIEKLGIEYHPLLLTHHFDLSMYHKNDGHPNNKGYTYISSIVEEILKLKENQ